MKKSSGFKESFGYALAGVAHCLKSERNFRFHSFAAAVVILCGLFFHLALWEWVAVLLVIALVLMSEMLNTALESLVDLCVTEYHPLAKVAKDVAAGAVFVFCFFAAIIGLIIFIPHILSFLG